MFYVKIKLNFKWTMIALFKNKYVICNIWGIFIVNIYVLFIFNSNLMEFPAFYLVTLLMCLLKNIILKVNVFGIWIYNICGESYIYVHIIHIETMFLSSLFFGAMENLVMAYLREQFKRLHAQLKFSLKIFFLCK